MKILIIGSKGFIGAHCFNQLSEKYNVWGCDVVPDDKATKYIGVDPKNAQYFKVFEDHKFQVCINCSGAASVPNSILSPQLDFELNALNVFKQLEAIRKYNPECKYINMSSAAVYGNPKYRPIDEGHPLNPISPYGVHKKMAEDICKEFYEVFNIPTCSLRIFSAYGEGLQKQLFWDLYAKSRKENKVSLFGTGNESRDFIHVEDLVRAIEIIMLKSNFNNTIFNVANGVEYKISNVVSQFYKLVKPEVNVQFEGAIRKGDPVNWVADISKLKELGYKSSINISEGLNRYAKWLQENA